MPQCPNCKITLSSNQSLEYHLKQQVCQRKMCPICHQYYKNRQGLKYHLDNSKSKCGVLMKIKTDEPVTKKVLRRKDTLVPLNNFNFSENPKVQTAVTQNQNIMTLAQVLLTSDQFKEYWSIYVDRIKSPHFLIFDGNKWQYRPRNMVIDFICNKIISLNPKFESLNRNSSKYKDFKEFICCIIHSNRMNVQKYAQEIGLAFNLI